MAAVIESTLNIKVILVDGHNGIYEVSVNDEVLYSNQRQCRQGFPDEILIAAQIGQLLGIEPKKDSLSNSQQDENQGECCPLPRQDDTDSPNS